MTLLEQPSFAPPALQEDTAREKILLGSAGSSFTGQEGTNTVVLLPHPHWGQSSPGTSAQRLHCAVLHCPASGKGMLRAAVQIIYPSIKLKICVNLIHSHVSFLFPES